MINSLFCKATLYGCVGKTCERRKSSGGKHASGRNGASFACRGQKRFTLHESPLQQRPFATMRSSGRRRHSLPGSEARPQSGGGCPTSRRPPMIGASDMASADPCIRLHRKSATPKHRRIAFRFHPMRRIVPARFVVCPPGRRNRAPDRSLDEAAMGMPSHARGGEPRRWTAQRPERSFHRPAFDTPHAPALIASTPTGISALGLRRSSFSCPGLFLYTGKIVGGSGNWQSCLKNCFQSAPQRCSP